MGNHTRVCVINIEVGGWEVGREEGSNTNDECGETLSRDHKWSTVPRQQHLPLCLPPLHIPATESLSKSQDGVCVWWWGGGGWLFGFLCMYKCESTCECVTSQRESLIVQIGRFPPGEILFTKEGFFLSKIVNYLDGVQCLNQDYKSKFRHNSPLKN